MSLDFVGIVPSLRPSTMAAIVADVLIAKKAAPNIEQPLYEALLRPYLHQLILRVGDDWAKSMIEFAIDEAQR